MNKIIGLFRLLRFELPFAAGICVVLGQILALDYFPAVITMLSGFSAVFFISSSILVMNDFFDVETDYINSPNRPIPSGMVKPYEALLFALFLLAVGIIVSYSLGNRVFLIALVLALVGFLYNRFFKKSGIWGNLMVSFSVGMTFIFGGASVGTIFEKNVIFFAVIAALIDFGEEIAADAMDMEGDKLIGSKSIAIKYGKIAALRTSAGLFISVIILSFIPFIFGWFQNIFLIPILFMDIIISYSVIKLLNSKKSEGRELIRWIYLGSTLSLLIFIIIKLIYN